MSNVHPFPEPALNPWPGGADGNGQAIWPPAEASPMGPAAAVRARPRLVTAVLTAVGYGLVIGTFAGLVPRSVYPDVGLATVNLLADAIAVVNAAATASLLLGWRWIRRGEVGKHRAAMLTAFGLILAFLVLYLLKVGGGGTKLFVGPEPAYYAYLGLLAVHVVLSVLAVPLVVYQVVTGLAFDRDALRRRTAHVRVGRLAVAAWVVSLTLGVVTYLLLNHVYAWRFETAAMALAG